MNTVKYIGSVLLLSAVAIPASWAEDSHKTSPHAAPHWGYDGAEGPEHWGSLDSAFQACATGQEQSPINISAPVTEDLPDLTFNYNDSAAHILNNGHTVQLNYDKGSTLKVGDETYNLLQLHFHTPSENQIDGQSYPMEMHLVHQRADGALGVLGVMIEEGAPNEAAARIWAHLPMQAQPETTYTDVTFNARDLVPENHEYYRFMGSLTTPPCTEGVNWHVMKTPITFSKAQIAQFQQAFEMNARPPQPLNNRQIVAE